MSRPARAAGITLLVVLIAGCKSNNPPTPSPGGDGGETITGRERIGWNQTASTAAELATFRYAIYVDGTRSEIAGTSCTPTATSGGFPCSGQLPSMAPGSHVLELAAFTTTGGIVESARSAPLRVTVTSATSPVVSAVLADGERLTTKDGVELTAALVADNFTDIRDLARLPDGRLLIAEDSGRLHLAGADGGSLEELRYGAGTGEGKLLGLTLPPDVGRSGHVFIISSVSGVFRLSRYRRVENELVERMHVLPDIKASNNPSAAVRFGADGKLYAAFDDADDRDAAARLSEWSGKILRLNPDGRTPDDQPAASPVFWSGLTSPQGLDWTPEEGVLWVAERGRDGIERIRALQRDRQRPRRTGQQAYYVLPRPFGAAGLAFHHGENVPQFRNDLFIAARDGGYLLRIGFDDRERSRAVTTEKLLEGKLGSVRGVQVDPDGAIYLATASAVWRLTKTSPEVIR